MKKKLSYIQTIAKYKLEITAPDPDYCLDSDEEEHWSVFSMTLGGSWAEGSTVYEAIDNWKEENLK